MRQPGPGERGSLDAGPRLFLTLYEQHQGTVYRFVRARGADPLQAEDITAQTFLHALQAFPRFHERGVPAEAWLRRIAANVLTDQARRDRRYVPLSLSPRQQEDGPACRGDTPEQWVEARERAAVVRHSLGVLSADQRRALWLRYGEDRSVRDVALTLGRSEGATKVLLHRALDRLRRHMQVAAARDDAAGTTTQRTESFGRISATWSRRRKGERRCMSR